MKRALEVAAGLLKYTEAEFLKCWYSTKNEGVQEGTALLLEPKPDFYRQEGEEKPEDDKITEIQQYKDIEIRNLLFQYEGPHSEKVLNNISLVIPAKKITAIVGISGSGKTTLIKLLLGFYNPVKGDILLGGIQLSRFSQSEWRKNVVW